MSPEARAKLDAANARKAARSSAPRQAGDAQAAREAEPFPRARDPDHPTPEEIAAQKDWVARVLDPETASIEASARGSRSAEGSRDLGETESRPSDATGFEEPEAKVHDLADELHAEGKVEREGRTDVGERSSEHGRHPARGRRARASARWRGSR